MAVWERERERFLGGVRSGMVALTVPYACGIGVGSGWGGLCPDWPEVSGTATVRVNCRVPWRVLCHVCNRNTQPSGLFIYIAIIGFTLTIIILQ